MVRAAATLPTLPLVLALSGCTITGPPTRPDFTSVNPRDRAAAAVKAAKDNDRSALPDLIDMLDAADPGGRFVASTALVSITGLDMGYDPFASFPARDAAAQRWADWYAAGEPAGEAGAGEKPR